MIIVYHPHPFLINEKVHLRFSNLSKINFLYSEPSPKPDNRDDASIIDDEDLGRSSAMDDTVKDTDDDDVVSPSIPKADIKTPPHQKEPSPLPQSPVDSKKKPSTPSPPPATNNEADDFFD
jgi:hypothetical protein